MKSLMCLVSRQQLEYWKKGCEQNQSENVVVMIGNILDSSGSEYIAVQSELTALREELVNHISSKNAFAQNPIDLQKRAIAAEQRNARLISLLKHFASIADIRQVGTLAMDAVAELSKPTESGASDEQ